MKKLLLLLLFISSHVFATSNFLILGDSHSVGPLGKTLFKNLSKRNNTNVALYGHSSSAALHWVSDFRYKLAGGVNHSLFLDGKYYKNPNDTDYRVRREVPKIQDVLSGMVYDEEWKREVGNISRIDTVVVVLGANDIRAVATESGKLKKASKRRAVAINKLIDQVESIGAKCIWIGPPNGTSSHHTNARQMTLYRFLKTTIGDRCEFFSSNHYKVKGCDKIHFSCKAERKNGRKLANEATKFILKVTAQDNV